MFLAAGHRRLGRRDRLLHLGQTGTHLPAVRSGGNTQKLQSVTFGDGLPPPLVQLLYRSGVREPRDFRHHESVQRRPLLVIGAACKGSSRRYAS